MYDRKLVAIIGLRGSGKDTAAQALIRRGFENIKFAGAFKEMLRSYFHYIGVSPELTERAIEGDLKETNLGSLMGKSPRFAMQTLGTEWGRKIIGENIWLDACLARADQFERVVFTDARFTNEIEAIKKNGGDIIRITRPGTETDEHESERLIEALPVDFDIINDSTIEELHTQVLEIVKL